MHNAISAQWHLISVQGLEYIVHFIVGLAYFYNKYVKSIWYYCYTPDLGLRTVAYYGYGRTFYGRIFINFPVTRTVKSF